MMKPEIRRQPAAGSCRSLFSIRSWALDVGRWTFAFLLGRPSSAFSLIEVTLAMMVMAVGILGIMVLFPAALQQNERSIGDTHAAVFAEEVFAGLQAKAGTNWATLEAFTMPIAAANMWSNLPAVRATNYPKISTNRYLVPSEPYEDHALRYCLATNSSAVGLRKNVTLFVWPGEFGGTNDPDIFYMEFFRWKP
ncbi:MAG: hypothetical protein HYV35_01985 [Lentisphaerae bacterium]|nr:hypothetical protein [Lentisphaerota bacterium]